ncbi:hypothetical protein [Brevibacillus agri]|uniref:hypothetical protein n=1 Tax=Brevibacillus agri TaxID=51101 RepID=UPI001F5DA391|nr:hypothetical protein [Brevibacillus agri]
MYKTTKWTVATFCLVAAVFGCVAENVIQNTLTNYERIFYATLVNQNKKVKKTEAIKLLSVDKMADDTIKAEFLIANENKDVEISLPVEKVDGEWKLIVDGSVTVENK